MSFYNHLLAWIRNPKRYSTKNQSGFLQKASLRHSNGKPFSRDAEVKKQLRRVSALANQKKKVHRSLIWVNLLGKGDIQSSMQKWEKIKLKTSLLLIFFRLLFFLLPKRNRRFERVYRTAKCIHTAVFLQVQMNYITIVSRTDFFSCSFSRSLTPRPH